MTQEQEKEWKAVIESASLESYLTASRKVTVTTPNLILAVDAELTRLKDELSGKTAKVQIDLVNQKHQIDNLRAEVERLKEREKAIKFEAQQLNRAWENRGVKCMQLEQSIISERKAIAEELIQNEMNAEDYDYLKQFCDRIIAGEFAK